jgi:hypothetical protein
MESGIWRRFVVCGMGVVRMLGVVQDTLHRCPGPVRRVPSQGNSIWNFLDTTIESNASPGVKAKMNQSFLVLFFKKEQEKELLFEKRSKNFC